MNLESKKSALLGLFLSFPSTSKMDMGIAMASVATYLETLQPISSETLSAACDRFRRKPSAFPPSAGELYDECLKIDAEAKRHADWVSAGSPRAQPRLKLGTPPRRGYSLADLANFDLAINAPKVPYTMRVDADGVPLKIPANLPGAGQPVFYGYLTPGEVADSKNRPAEHVPGHWNG